MKMSESPLRGLGESGHGILSLIEVGAKSLTKTQHSLSTTGTSYRHQGKRRCRKIAICRQGMRGGQSVCSRALQSRTAR